jgi:hypothetical protein
VTDCHFAQSGQTLATTPDPPDFFEVFQNHLICNAKDKNCLTPESQTQSTFQNQETPKTRM